MKCPKCGKEMDREDGGITLQGIIVKVAINENPKTPETVSYNNLQLGKYSDGKGGCSLGICFECYIDGLAK